MSVAYAEFLRISATFIFYLLNRPSAMKEVAVEVPHVQWNDIGG